MRSVEGNYCNMPPRQDAGEATNNCLLEHEEPRKILHKKNSAKLLEGDCQIGDDIESGKKICKRKKKSGYI